MTTYRIKELDEDVFSHFIPSGLSFIFLILADLVVRSREKRFPFIEVQLPELAHSLQFRRDAIFNMVMLSGPEIENISSGNIDVGNTG